MRVLKIVEGTSVDGPGLRTSVYLAGCRHHCQGCHNPQSWDPDGGREMSVSQLLEVISENEADVTLTGGDPLMQIEPLLELAKGIKALGLNIWLYTGYTFEQIMSDDSLRRITGTVDTIVDGPFISSLRDTSLLFRGSSNQRILKDEFDARLDAFIGTTDPEELQKMNERLEKILARKLKEKQENKKGQDTGK